LPHAGDFHPLLAEDVMQTFLLMLVQDRLGNPTPPATDCPSLAGRTVSSRHGAVADGGGKCHTPSQLAPDGSLLLCSSRLKHCSCYPVNALLAAQGQISPILCLGSGT